MKLRRPGDKRKHLFRNQRLCCENGKWYFQTREGTLIGPCNERSEARQLLAVFLAKTLRASHNPQQAIDSELVGVQDGVEGLVEELVEYYRVRTEVGEIAAHAWAINRIAELKDNWKIDEQERIDVLYHVLDRDQRTA